MKAQKKTRNENMSKETERLVKRAIAQCAKEIGDSKGVNKTQNKILLFVKILLREFRAGGVHKRGDNDLISDEFMKRLAKDQKMDMKKKCKALKSLRDPKKGYHPVVALCLGKFSLYTIMLMVPFFGGISGAVVGHWQANKDLRDGGIHQGRIAIMAILTITTLITELPAATGVACPLAPFVNGVIQPMKRISKFVEIRLVITWYFRDNPHEVERVASCLGIEPGNLHKVDNLLCDWGNKTKASDSIV